MNSPEAPRNLISYKSLCANGIQLNTTMLRGEEVLELRRGGKILATSESVELTACT